VADAFAQGDKVVPYGGAVAGLVSFQECCHKQATV
jgi:hypothetical protein